MKGDTGDREGYQKVSTGQKEKNNKRSRKRDKEFEKWGRGHTGGFEARKAKGAML